MERLAEATVWPFWAQHACEKERQGPYVVAQGRCRHYFCSIGTRVHSIVALRYDRHADRHSQSALWCLWDTARVWRGMRRLSPGRCCWETGSMRSGGAGAAERWGWDQAGMRTGKPTLPQVSAKTRFACEQACPVYLVVTPGQVVLAGMQSCIPMPPNGSTGTQQVYPAAK